MRRWGLWGLILCYMMGEGCVFVQTSAAVSAVEEEAAARARAHKKKKKSTKAKKHKPKKHKTKRHKPKAKTYSAQRIEKLLENDKEGGICNRLNCASNLKIAKSCLTTRASHRKNKDCFHAFCAYGCNEEDYKSKADVFDFCNATCSSKKYLKNKKRPE